LLIRIIAIETDTYNDLFNTIYFLKLEAILRYKNLLASLFILNLIIISDQHLLLALFSVGFIHKFRDFGAKCNFQKPRGLFEEEKYTIV
jgi:hypothetical protein